MKGGRANLELRIYGITEIRSYSPHIADLLVRTCVQIEAIAKELYFDNGGAKPRGDNSILFDEDCLRLVDRLCWEIAKYRLMKKIPLSLPFEERKALLLRSEEWNGWINQHNNHLKPEDINIFQRESCQKRIVRTN